MEIQINDTKENDKDKLSEDYSIKNSIKKLDDFMLSLNTLDIELIERLPSWVTELKQIWKEAKK